MNLTFNFQIPSQHWTQLRYSNEVFLKEKNNQCQLSMKGVIKTHCTRRLQCVWFLYCCYLLLLLRCAHTAELFLTAKDHYRPWWRDGVALTPVGISAEKGANQKCARIIDVDWRRFYCRWKYWTELRASAHFVTGMDHIHSRNIRQRACLRAWKSVEGLFSLTPWTQSLMPAWWVVSRTLEEGSCKSTSPKRTSYVSFLYRWYVQYV